MSAAASVHITFSEGNMLDPAMGDIWYNYSMDGMKELEAEIARLRAAFEEIDQHRLFMPEAQAYLELKQIARKALANEQSPISVPTDTSPAAAPPAE